MFIAKQNDLIITCAQTKEELEAKLACIPDATIEETDTEYTMFEGKVLTPDEVQEAKNNKIKMLKMTPRDFLLAVTQLGVKWADIKALMEKNDQVAIELQFCNFVYRGNPLLDQLCGQFGVTTEQLDEIFTKANN